MELRYWIDFLAGVLVTLVVIRIVYLKRRRKY